ncbi:MAG: PIN domain-containing protein [Actinobacteria bacterium]|nr:PIN domain-containing protein [Actinomycetota bacterium]MCA1721809.1 PIN domain-containing protein [Actinomycetota bacterium]
MLLLDVNVLLAASRDDHPHHGVARSWLAGIVGGNEQFAVPMGVWWSFLRLATNRRVFPTPTPLWEAFAFVDAVTAQPGHVPVQPSSRHLGLLRRRCQAVEASGDLLPDAVLATLAEELAATVVTFDRDFARLGVPYLVPVAP